MPLVLSSVGAKPSPQTLPLQASLSDSPLTDDKISALCTLVHCLHLVYLSDLTTRVGLFDPPALLSSLFMNQTGKILFDLFEAIKCKLKTHLPKKISLMI